MRSWRKTPPHYRDYASDAVIKAVKAYCDSGVKTFAAFDAMAPELETQPRRVRRLFGDDREPVVDRDECSRVMLGVARVLRTIAARLRDRADRWEREADAIEQKQLTLWGSVTCGVEQSVKRYPLAGAERERTWAA